jgi:hypothetical protein
MYYIYHTETRVFGKAHPGRVGAAVRSGGRCGGLFSRAGEAYLGVGAAARFALDKEPAAVLLDDGLREGQADAGALVRTGGFGVEGVDYEGLFSARAAVDDLDQELAAALVEEGEAAVESLDPLSVFQ